MRLTDAKIRAAQPRAKLYRLADRDGLLLEVAVSGAKFWRFRYKLNGQASMIKLGDYPTVSLGEARDLAIDARRKVRAGVKPSADAALDVAMRAEITRLSLALEQAYAEIAVLKANGGRVQHEAAKPPLPFGKTVRTWFERYAEKRKLSAATMRLNGRSLGYVVAQVGEDSDTRTLTAPMLARAVNAVVAANGYQQAGIGLNLARNALAEQVQLGELPHNVADNVTIDSSHATKTESRAAITKPAELGAFLAAVDASSVQPTFKRALRLLALTFPRPSELSKARWDEFTLDGDEPQWCIPAERMKLRREHVVPLSRQAVALLLEARAEQGEPDAGFVVSLDGGRNPTGENTLRRTLDRIGYAGKHSLHGFRSTASTLLHEQGFNSDAIEVALAHKIPGVKGVYNRSHLLPYRRDMLQKWADYLEQLRA